MDSMSTESSGMGTTKMKATLYYNGMFGYQRVEVTAIGVDVRRYAQYPRGVHVEFVPKGKRKARAFVQGFRPSVVVLEGWGHPEPANWLRQRDDGSAVSRMASCDPGWATEFDAMLAAHVEATGAKVLHDFRGFDTASEVAA